MALDRQVRTQKELDGFFKEHPRSVPILIGDDWFEIRGSSHVEAWESSHVVAWESSHVEARGSSHVEATRFVAIHKHSQQVTLAGGVVIDVLKPTSPTEWCDFYGAPVTDGVAILYKAVRDDYRSGRGLLYEPGKTAEAPDWDGGKAECGRGLHFTAHPSIAQGFDDQATRFVACPVALEDMRPPSEQDSHPSKIKARRVCGPIYEVDRFGKPVVPATAKRA